jgi:alkanesulfonate monooxygenase SsuD/methylene tetrahydromethanopterin reductase-like flavin-dependent oxidoreductase (luciferase family)
MNLGFFLMPVHRPEKPWGQALAEDREAIIQADGLGLTEVWIGEHFSSKAEQIPSPMMFLATLVEAAGSIRFGTGVVNLPHHNPIVVAAEAAMFDQLCGGRLILGVGPGGLASDGELFGREDMSERYAIAMESLDTILALWRQDAPLRLDGPHWNIALEKEVWRHGGVGALPRPLQQPHPPIAMAMVGPGGRTAEIIAERDIIPISANFIPLDIVEAQWTAYAAARDGLGKPADRSIWRVCRNILVTGSRQEAEDALSDPDGSLAFYFRYLRGVRRMGDLRAFGEDRTPAELNEFLSVNQAYEECVIAGTTEQVLGRLVEVVERLGPFGNLIMVGHDWDETDLWQSSMKRLAKDVMPKLAQHANQRRRH